MIVNIGYVVKVITKFFWPDVQGVIPNKYQNNPTLFNTLHTSTLKNYTSICPKKNPIKTIRSYQNERMSNLDQPALVAFFSCFRHNMKILKVDFSWGSQEAALRSRSEIADRYSQKEIQARCSLPTLERKLGSRAASNFPIRSWPTNSSLNFNKKVSI